MALVVQVVYISGLLVPYAQDRRITGEVPIVDPRLPPGDGDGQPPDYDVTDYF
jgi:hypothetical protein